MLGKEEEATPTLTVWLSSSPCPAPRNAPDGIRAKDRREVSNQRPSPNLGPPRPLPGEPLPRGWRGGRKGAGNESGGGSSPPPPSGTGSLCSRRRSGQTPVRPQSWKGIGGEDVVGSPLVPAPALSPLLRVGPLTQLSLAHISARETEEIRPLAPQCVPAPNAPSLPPAQGRISKHATLHTPRLAPGSEGGGVAGRRGAPRPAAP